MNNEEIKETLEFLESKKHKRNMNAFFREDIGINKAPHPEADNGFERLRTYLFLKYPKYPWISRLYKSRKRRGRN